MGKKQKIKIQKKVEESRNISREIRNKDRGVLYYIIYTGLIILLLYPPYFRGMFFNKEFLPTHIYSGILLLLYVIFKSAVLKERQFFRTPMDYGAIALVGAYFLSIFAAVNIRSAIGEFLKYINYFAAFYIVSDIARSEKDIKKILWAMVISAFGVAFIGIGAAAGTFTYNGAFVGGRINSTIQYPNTLAAYLTAAFMITTALWATSQSRTERGILAVVNYTLILTFIFTLSRGAWLLFPAFLLVMIFGMPGSYRMKAIGYFLQTIASALLASPGFGMSISAQNEKGVWLWFFAGALVSFGLFYLFERISERFAFKIKPKVVFTTFTIILIIAGIGAYTAFTEEAPLVISHGEHEEASWKTSWYPLQDVKPDAEYTLKFTLSAKPGEEEGHWGAAVLINSYDDAGNSVRILSEYIEEEVSEEVREVTFKTRSDTVRLSIGFSNRFPGTEATFYDAELYETNSTASSRRITLAYKYIPEAISKRIRNISIEDSSVAGRFAFYRDALKIIKDHPVLGTGGGGWKSAYFTYQSYRYFTTEVHNFFLQLWVETGTLGMLSLLGLILAALRSIYAVHVSDMSTSAKALTWGAFSGAAALLGHSGMDFNLSLGAVSLYLWELFGIINSPSALHRRERKGFKMSWQALPVGGLAFILIILGTLLYQGYTYGQQAVESVKQKDLASAREYFEKAAKFDPYTASFKADLAQLDYIMAVQTEDEELIKKSEKMRLEAVDLDPYNANLRSQLASYYLRQGKLDEGLMQLEKAAELNPFNASHWENLADAYYKTAVIYARKDKDVALDLAEKSLKIYEKIAECNSRELKRKRDKMYVTNELMLYTYKIKLLAENIDDETYYRELEKLVFASDFTADSDRDGMPDLWRYSNSKAGYIKSDITPEVAKITNEGEGTSYLYTRKDFSLKPNTKYKVKLVAGGDMPEDKIRFYVFSREGERTQFQWKKIKLTPGLSELTATFTTTDDIVEGKQWLRMNISAAKENYIQLKAIEIWEE